MARKSSVQFTVTIPITLTLKDGAMYKDAMDIIREFRGMVEQDQFMSTRVERVTMERPIVQKRVVY